MNILTIPLTSIALPHFYLVSKTMKSDYTLHRLKTMKTQAMKTMASAGKSYSMTSVIAFCSFFGVSVHVHLQFTMIWK